MKNKKLAKLILIAMLAAVMCVLAPISFPVGAVPISLGTFALYIISTVSDRKTGTAAVLLYILLGLIGVPVFTGWTGGFAKLAGPTGGYIVGYIPCAYIVGFIADKLERHKWVFPLGMVAGTTVLYAFGTAWFMIQSETALVPALLSCVVPFLPGDAVKIIISTVVAIPVRAQLKKLSVRTAKSDKKSD